jgi:hypothetical protein
MMCAQYRTENPAGKNFWGNYGALLTNHCGESGATSAGQAILQASFRGFGSFPGPAHRYWRGFT